MKELMNKEVKQQILSNASELQDALNKLEYALHNQDTWDVWVEDRQIHLYEYGLHGGEFVFNKNVSSFLIKDRALKSALSSKFARRLAYMSLDRYVGIKLLADHQHNQQLEKMLDEMEEFINDDLDNEVECAHMSMSYME